MSKCYYYSEVFDRQVPQSPTSHRISFYIGILFLGWLNLRSQILEFFKESKDPEVATVIYFLDELIPVAFFSYSVMFRIGDLQQYRDFMKRLAIAMLCFRRRYYDKATLSWLSDDDHY